MFKTLATLIHGQNARAEDRVRDAFAIELIDQKIRESEGSLRAAKGTLASLIQRQRSEEKQRAALKNRITDLTKRAKEALDNDREDMAEDAARAIATMENELTIREETLDRLEQKVIRLRSSIESGHRRIIDLKQGAIQARAVRREQNMQVHMSVNGLQQGAVEEAAVIGHAMHGREDAGALSGGRHIFSQQGKATFVFGMGERQRCLLARSAVGKGTEVAGGLEPVEKERLFKCDG